MQQIQGKVFQLMHSSPHAKRMTRTNSRTLHLHASTTAMHNSNFIVSIVLREGVNTRPVSDMYKTQSWITAKVTNVGHERVTRARRTLRGMRQAE